MINKQEVHERLEVIGARIKDAQSVVALIRALYEERNKSESKEVHNGEVKGSN